MSGGRSGAEPKSVQECALIRDVWADNLEEEFEAIRSIIDEYPCVAMDTEFPGVVARPVGKFESAKDFNFAKLRCNVNLLKIIQLGLTFSNLEGEHPPGVCCWQFNFKFNLNGDMYAQDSIDLLVHSGIDFDVLPERGIDLSDFAELLMTSGVVLNPDVKWISFHSGYDFGYLTKLLTCQDLPSTDKEFFELLHTYFPCIFDIKYLMEICDRKGGLNQLAEEMNVDRIGPMHQAGSDSLLTSHVFFKLLKVYFSEGVTEDYEGMLYGLSDLPQGLEKVYQF